MANVSELLLAVALGVLIGTVASWLVLRARQTTTGAHDAALAERARAEIARAERSVADARAEAADARAEAAGARSEASRTAVAVAEARTEAAAARADMADALAEVAALNAAVGQARAEAMAARQRADEQAADREILVNQFKVLSAETMERQGKSVDASAEHRFKATEQLMGPVRASLQEFNARLTEVEKERVAMATDLRAQVKAVQLTGEQVRVEAQSLSRALRKPHVRGNWGEQQLKRVVELAGMVEHCDFLTQQTTSTTAGNVIRPDMKVLLDGQRFIYVDSKVPLSAFMEAFDTEDEDARERSLNAFAKNVRTHVDQLSGKEYYKAHTGTPEFVVLFVPSEALATEALNRMPELNEYAAQRAVILATPTTLIALLRAVAYGWKQVGLAESAQQVFELARELYDRLGTLGGHFDKIGRSLTASVRAYNDAVGSIEGRVFPAARKLRELRVTDKELTAVSPVDAAPRPITAPELVEDAAQVTPMIGAGGRRRGETERAGAERAELVRGVPELEDLITEAERIEAPVHGMIQPSAG